MKYGRNLLGKNEFRRKDNGMTKKKKKKEMLKTAKNTIAELKPALKAIKKKKRNVTFTEESKIRAVIRCSLYFKFIRKSILRVGAIDHLLFKFQQSLGQR